MQRPSYTFRLDPSLKRRVKDCVNYMQNFIDPSFTSEALGSLALELAMSHLEKKHTKGKIFPSTRHPIRRGPSPEAEA